MEVIHRIWLCGYVEAIGSHKSATINSLWQTTEPYSGFLPLWSKYHITYVTHYLLLLVLNLLLLKLYGPCLWHSTSFLTWSIFKANDKNLSNVPRACCSSFLSSTERSLSRYLAYWCFGFFWATCGLDLLVQDVESRIRTLFFWL